MLPPALIPRLDRTEAQLCSGIARVAGARDPESRWFVREVAGGAGIYAGPGSPMNKLIGAAFGSVPEESEIAEPSAATT